MDKVYADVHSKLGAKKAWRNVHKSVRIRQFDSVLVNL